MSKPKSGSWGAPAENRDNTDVIPTFCRRHTYAYFSGPSGRGETLNSFGIGMRLNASNPAIL